MSGEVGDLRDEPEDWRPTVLNTALRVAAVFYSVLACTGAAASYLQREPLSNVVGLLGTVVVMLWAAFTSRGSHSIRAAVAVGTVLGAGLLFIPFVGVNSTVTSLLTGAAMLALLTLGPRAAVFALVLASLGLLASAAASAFGWVTPPQLSPRPLIGLRFLFAFLAFGGGSVAAVHFIIERLERTTRQLRERTIALHADITAREQLEGQLVQAAKMEAVGRLAGGIAHDFNNLLTIILGYTDVLGASMPLPPAEQRHLDSIRAAASSASSLTRQLLAFSRKQILEPQIVDMNAIVEKMLALLRRLLGEDIVVEMRLADGLHLVRADPGQIEQVILNLCLNARDAMTGGGRLTIATSNRDLSVEEAALVDGVDAGPHAALAVTDSGAGMTADVQSRIFEPFYTTKESSKGTGLGLSTVYGILRQSGGSVSVRSQPGAGTTFTVMLPRAESGEVTAPAASSLRRGGSETILVVEDEREVREIINLFLDDGGYAVLHAANGLEALRVCERNPRLHLVLTDVIMPDMGGAELSARLAASRPHIRVLMMSGYVDDATIREVQERGRVILRKPFTRDGLLQAVRQALDDVPTAR